MTGHRAAGDRTSAGQNNQEAKALKQLTVKQYSERTGTNERQVRRLIKSGQLPSSRSEVKGRIVTMVLVDDDIVIGPDVSREEKVLKNEMSGHTKEAEIIEESTNYNLVSMDNTVFDQLIDSIKTMANDRHASDKEAYKALQDEYFELKMKVSGLEKEIKDLVGQLHSEKLNSAQAESQAKILEVRLEEKEKTIAELIAQQNSSIWFKKL